MKRSQRNAEHSQDSTDTRDWVLDDETKFIQYSDRAKGRQGMDFDKFWVDAATEMSKNSSQGTPISADAYQFKWPQTRNTFHVVDKLANMPDLSHSLEQGAGVTAESETICGDFIMNTPRAKLFKTKGRPHYEILKSSESVTDEPTVPLDNYAFHPAMQPSFDPCNLSSSDSSGESDDMWIEYHPPKYSNAQRNAPSVSTEALHVSLLQSLERFGEAVRKLAFEQPLYSPGTSTSCSVDPIPVRKRRAIIQVQKEDLEDHEILIIINVFQADVAVADSYLAIGKDSIRRLFLAEYLKK
ncbi:hypothetical protein DFH29DRAFT_993077 [Suillus ampliporus]|nr:hypothetical protein DFH29DRAFT_993077 [Suillus ampliporus]